MKSGHGEDFGKTRLERLECGGLSKEAVGGIGHKRLYHELASSARKMRENPTVAESRLWNEIRESRLGARFRRQYVIDRFIVDFCCIKLRLAIEVDGSVHDTRKEYDAERDLILESYGCKVLRFPNAQVTGEIEIVLNAIRHAIECRIERTPPNKFPRRGTGV
ncbi:endonuclease domain-containing protein [Candidatus Uhrbacteria bacterium]|nr:endonuclease domain-containing protein [Candidatus Uhrbacteria bacterium]